MKTIKDLHNEEQIEAIVAATMRPMKDAEVRHAAFLKSCEKWDTWMQRGFWFCFVAGLFGLAFVLFRAISEK